MALQTFSPRDIQARVRGGDSAEVVAAETGWPLDKVLRYAEPMLAERAFIAEQAQAVEVRRSGGGATLLQASAAALGVDSSGVEWDAYRRGDGKWIVSATYREADGPHAAQWTYDHVGRNLHPLDDDARTLMGARPLAVPDDELDIADALDLVTQATADEPAETRPRLMAVPDSDDESAEADEPEAPARANHSESTISIPHPSGTGAASTGGQETGTEEPAEKASRAKTPAAAKAPAAKTTAAKTTAAKKAPARKPRARKGRASVPSWDEILFGATKPDSDG